MKISFDAGQALYGIGLIMTASMAFLSWRQSRGNSKQIAENTALTQLTHEEVNGQSQMLRDNAYAKGQADEKANPS